MSNATVKLYDTKPYDNNFEASVVDIIKDKKTRIVLDQTLFFPEEGGQTPDKGYIRLGEHTFDVIDVQIEDEVIYHYIKGEAKGLDKGSLVSAEIDFDYRFSNMQQHSGEHIFSGLAKRYYGCTNVGFHLSDSEVTFDYDKPLTADEIKHLETEVNKVIFEDHPIKAYYPPKDELLNLDYRSKKEIDGDVRIVEIEGIDFCACCAPHVRSTAQVGICKVVDYINYKGGVRISILCGMRALELFRQLDDTTKSISRNLSAKRESLDTEVDRINTSLKEAEYKLIAANKRYLDLILSNMDDNSGNFILLRLDDFDNKSLRDAVNELKEKYPNKLVGTISKTDKGYFFIIGSVNLDCNKVATILRESYSAKGGGSSDMIQGNITSELSDDDVTKIYDSVV